jgi:hypothetical protein
MASTKPIQPLHLIKPHHQARPSCYDHQSTPDFPCRTIITVNTPNPSPKLNQSPPSIPADHQHHKNHRPPHHRSQLYLAVDSSSPPLHHLSVASVAASCCPVHKVASSPSLHSPHAVDRTQ